MAAQIPPARSLEAAIDAFLAQPDFARESRKTYRMVLDRLAVEVDREGRQLRAVACEPRRRQSSP
jgi:hypothetical protein